MKWRTKGAIGPCIVINRVNGMLQVRVPIVPLCVRLIPCRATLFMSAQVKRLNFTKRIFSKSITINPGAHSNLQAPINSRMGRPLSVIMRGRPSGSINSEDGFKPS